MSGTGARLWVDGLASELEVAKFDGREALSALPRFELQALVGEADDAGGLLGAAARLALTVGGHTRAVSGLIWGVRRGARLAGGGQTVRFTLAPRARKLALRRQSRVFQVATSAAIAQQIFAEHDVPFLAELRHPLATREVCIQHDETDLQFVQRLLAEDGLAFRVESPTSPRPDESETTIVFDDPSAYPDMSGPPVLLYRPGKPSGGLVHEEHHLSCFLERHRRASSAVHARGFDFRRPLEPHTDGKPGLEAIVEDHGPYGEMQTSLQPIPILLDQVRRGALTYQGDSGCARLLPGARFTLEGHELPTLDSQYAVVGLVHRFRSVHEGELPSYQNEFVAVKREFLLRPERPRRRVRQSMETAIVVGPPGEEIHTDELGRIKVRFHWDLEPANERSSCWIRVAQSWAGARYGSQFIPRVGMEVLVTFLGGDPDRPVVVGCLPNATHPPAFPLPAEKGRSGIRTAPTPFTAKGTSNELSFQDSAGAEEVRLIARRDMNVAIARNRSQVISGADTLSVAHDRHVVVDGTCTTRIEGKVKTEYGSSAEVEVQGDLSERVLGKRQLDVEAHSSTTIGGLAETTVHAANRVTVAGPWVEHARSTYSLTVGDEGAPGRAEVVVRGSASHAVDQTSTFAAEGQLILRCGESQIVLSPRSIKIHSPELILEATDLKATGDGPQLRLSKKAELVSDEVAIRAQSSSLVLDHEANLRGSSIKLAKPEPPEKQLGEEPAAGNLRLVARLTNEKFEPYASKRYEIRAGDQKLEGTTDADGVLREDVPADATVARVELWTEGFPRGPRNTYTIKIEPLPPIDSLAGVRVRLENLGYPAGPREEPDLDAATKAAIEDFQTDHELPRTGEQDDATCAALLEKHGS